MIIVRLIVLLSFVWGKKKLAFNKKKIKSLKISYLNELKVTKPNTINKEDTTEN